jgi:SAM-dependent methyltransferase
MSARARMTAIAKRSRAAVIAARIAKDRVAALGMRLRVPIKRQGATHRGLPVARSLEYIDEVFSDYLRYSELGESELAGASVLELGPGDNFGVALRLIGAGAERVTTLDRFITWRDPEQQQRIHQALIASLPAQQAERARAALSPTSEFGVDPSRIRVLQGVAAENAPSSLGDAGFDLIVSRAVLEHVNDLAGAFSAMDRMLAPNGVMAHKVDLRDHGLFTHGGHNPLTFLTIGDRVYRWMGEHSGLPNRCLSDRYRAELARRDYEARILVTHVIGHEPDVVPHPEQLGEALLAPAREMIAEIRPRLLPRFRALSDEDLATAGIFLIIRSRV